MRTNDADVFGDVIFVDVLGNFPEAFQLRVKCVVDGDGRTSCTTPKVVCLGDA
jgi:hypothetical protein